VITSKVCAQITVTPGSAPNQPRIDPSIYDSSFNFDRDRRELLIGQQVYFIPFSKKYTDNKPELSDRFLTDPSEFLRSPNSYTRERLPAYCVYKPVRTNANIFQTPLNEDLGRYFIVTDFAQNNSALNYQDLLNLMGLYSAENRNDIVYYRLDGTSEYTNTGVYDFLVVGYYEKLKQRYINQYYYLAKSTYFRMDVLPAKDVITGELVSLKDNNERWQCLDVTLLETSTYPKLVLSLLLRNSKGATIAASIDFPDYTIKPYLF